MAGVGKRKVDVFESVREEARFRRFARLQRVDIQGQLKQMMGPEAQFRGMQEEVIRAIVRGESPIIQVAGTGEGKSMSFMLPAFCSPDGVTVVVVPLVALRGDLHGRCQRMGIDAHVWQGQGVNRAAAIVFVTPESAVTVGFRSFANRLQARGQLDRIVVDECHTVLDSERRGGSGRRWASWGPRCRR
jgi:superfamily II DNA helicase RecQ